MAEGSKTYWWARRGQSSPHDYRTQVYADTAAKKRNILRQKRVEEAILAGRLEAQQLHSFLHLIADSVVEDKDPVPVIKAFRKKWNIKQLPLADAVAWASTHFEFEQILRKKRVKFTKDNPINE